MTDNPLPSQSASSSTAIGKTAFAESRPFSAIARETFLAWEKLRIIYIAILTLITALLIGPADFWNPRLMMLTVEGAVVANIAYFAGPLVETYMKWLGYHRSWPRWVMFCGGTLLSIFLAVAAIFSEMFPFPD